MLMVDFFEMWSITIFAVISTVIAPDTIADQLISLPFLFISFFVTGDFLRLDLVSAVAKRLLNTILVIEHHVSTIAN